MRFKHFFQKYFLSSLKSTITTLYLPIVIICILVTGFVSMRLATAQVEENAYKNITDTVFQTKNYLEYTLSDVFTQLVSLSYDSRIMNILLKDEEEIEPQDYIPINQNVQLLYSRYASILDSIVVDMNDGEFLVYQSNDNRQPKVNYGIFDQYDTRQSNFYWRNVHVDNVFTTGRQVLSMYTLLQLDYTDGRGIILFNLKGDFFDSIFNRSLIGENGYLTLISNDGVYESKRPNEAYKLSAETITAIQALDAQQGQFHFENEQHDKMIVLYDTIATNGWKVAAVVPEQELMSKVNYIKYFTFALVFLMIGLVIFLTNFLMRFVTKPFAQLAKQMGSVDAEHLRVDAPLQGPDEMKVLHNGFTDMMGRIHHLMDQVVLEQEEKRRLEFAIMQAQINPHFLYNTLYSIKGLCDMDMTQEASQMITALSNFFRIGISKGSEVITIEEEIAHIKSYLYIQEMRYGDDFNYELHIEESIMSYDIVKLSLQPLIENAIYHGVKQKRGKGTIVINGFEQNDIIVLEVSDNGHGMTASQLTHMVTQLQKPYYEKSETMGIGVKSVNERIKIHFGREYGLFITSIEGQGTTIRITIPKQQGAI